MAHNLTSKGAKTPNAEAATAAAADADATLQIADYEKRILIDGSGLECPEPLMLLRKGVREAKEGQLIELLSEDPVSLRDVPAYCEFMHHTLVRMPSPEHPHSFLIRKGSSAK